jgi:hypothetical protein
MPLAPIVIHAEQGALGNGFGSRALPREPAALCESVDAGLPPEDFGANGGP